MWMMSDADSTESGGNGREEAEAEAGDTHSSFIEAGHIRASRQLVYVLLL